MGWEGERDERELCGFIAALYKRLGSNTHSSINLVVSFSWEAVMTIAPGKGSININLVAKTLSVETDYLGSNLATFLASYLN